MNDNKISPPDPSCDYYIHYHKLLRAKSKIEDLIEWLREIDSGTDEIDASLDDDLLEIIKIIEDTRSYEARSLYWIGHHLDSSTSRPQIMRLAKGRAQHRGGVTATFG